jgi:hypothetical protein
MTGAIILPDAVQLVRDGLLADVTVTGLVDTRVLSQLPSSPTYPCVVIYRFGGKPPVREWVDQAQLQIDCWATDDIAASLVARTVRAAVHNLEGYSNPTLGSISGVDDVEGPRWGIEDTSVPLTTTPRYVLTVAVYTHP